MEKLITKRNLSLLGIVSFLLVIALYFILQNNSKDDEKLFDIFWQSFTMSKIQI